MNYKDSSISVSTSKRPPYNVPIDGHVCGSGRIRHREFARGVGETSPADFAGFLEQTLGPAALRWRDGAIAFVCMDWRHAQELLVAGKSVFAELKSICVWNKTNAGMGTFYRSKHELVFVFKKGSAPHVNTFGPGETGRPRTNVWDYPGISSIGQNRMEEMAMRPSVANNRIEDIQPCGDGFAFATQDPLFGPLLAQGTAKTVQDRRAADMRGKLGSVQT